MSFGASPVISSFDFLWKGVRRPLWIWKRPWITEGQTVSSGVAAWQLRRLCLSEAVHSCFQIRQILLGSFLWQLSPPGCPLSSPSVITVVIRPQRKGGWGIPLGPGKPTSGRGGLFLFIWSKKSFCLGPAILPQPFRNRKSKGPPFPSLSPLEGPTSPYSETVGAKGSLASRQVVALRCQRLVNSDSERKKGKLCCWLIFSTVFLSWILRPHCYHKGKGRQIFLRDYWIIWSVHQNFLEFIIWCILDQMGLIKT